MLFFFYFEEISFTQFWGKKKCPAQLFYVNILKRYLKSGCFCLKFQMITFIFFLVMLLQYVYTFLFRLPFLAQCHKEMCYPQKCFFWGSSPQYIWNHWGREKKCIDFVTVSSHFMIDTLSEKCLIAQVQCCTMPVWLHNFNGVLYYNQRVMIEHSWATNI